MRYIAFLRAINVGGRIVKMDSLRRLIEALGFSNVETFIASGNLIFESLDGDGQALEKIIEGHLQAALGYEVVTFIRTAPELVEVASYKPFSPDLLETEGSSLYVMFLQSAPDPAMQLSLQELRTPVDEFHLQGREIYWFCRTKFSESMVSGPQLEKTIGIPTTVRNITTVRRLAAKYGVIR